MGLQELQKTWEVTNWVLQLFFQYLDRSTAARLQLSDDHPQAPSPERVRTGELTKKASHSSSATPKSPMDINGMAYGFNAGLAGDAAQSADTPWDRYLFSQIENDFSFGEGSNQNYLDLESWSGSMGEGMTW
jgi:hypothetical protein